jgi:hypothetical protein
VSGGIAGVREAKKMEVSVIQMTSLVLVSVFGLVSLVAGLGGAIMALSLYRSPHQRSILVQRKVKLVLAVSMGLLSGLAELTLACFLWWLGIYPASTVLVEFIATVVFVAVCTYGGWTIGVRIFERQADG